MRPLQLGAVHVGRAAGGAAVLAATLVLAGCGGATAGAGGQPSAAASTSAASPASSPSRLLGPDAFAGALSSGDRFVVNVHTPDQGSIAGTDAAIPFDRLSARAGELPAETTTPLAIYCRSGTMSAKASVTLAAMGYTDVVELRGGMKAWSAAGRELLP